MIDYARSMQRFREMTLDEKLYTQSKIEYKIQEITTRIGQLERHLSPIPAFLASLTLRLQLAHMQEVLPLFESADAVIDTTGDYRASLQALEHFLFMTPMPRLPDEIVFPVEEGA